ncbi:MAG TPA: type II toxin-antitoxin system VapC family toxin [Caulobacteraceae bacterium]|nr:type II toxin-antitoxin system VapC family toxin [Caulobacteraceae bacterium]
MSGFLLDTNVLLWLGLDNMALRQSVRRQLFGAPLYVSVVTAAEIAIKVSIGKLQLPPPFQTDFAAAFRTLLNRAAIDLIPLDLPVIDHLRGLPLHHRDPFDRIIIAQALASGLAVATRDRAFAAYEGLEILEV